MRPQHTTVLYTTLYYIRPHHNTLHGTTHHCASLTPHCAAPDCAMLHQTPLHTTTDYATKPLTFPYWLVFPKLCALHKAVVTISAFAWHMEYSIMHWFSSHRSTSAQAGSSRSHSQAAVHSVDWLIALQPPDAKQHAQDIVTHPVLAVRQAMVVLVLFLYILFF